MTDHSLTNEQVNTARTVRAGATVPEICMHNVKLGQGCFCPRCPTASYVSAPDSVPSPVATLRLLAKCGSMDLSALDGIADEFEHLDADAAGLQAELVSVKACWADMITQCDHWLEIAREKDAELERLRNIIHGCPVCSELERNIQPSHEPNEQCICKGCPVHGIPKHMSAEVTRLPVPGTKLTRLSDIADELIRQLRKQGMERMQAVFDGMLLRIDPEPPSQKSEGGQ